MAEYKLTYFDLAGRAEPIRFIFALAKVPFEDVQIKFQDWPPIKSTIQPWEQLPVLQFGGKTISQSITIGRFLAKRFNFAGANEFENAAADELVDAVGDLALELWMKYICENDATKKEAGKKNLVDNLIPKYFGKFDKILTENASGWLVGTSVTWADVHVVNVVESIEGFLATDFSTGYPQLKKMKEAFYALPGVKEYVANRPAGWASKM